MANAKRDQNTITTLIAVSSADGTTPVNVYADPVTHRLLTDNAGGGTGTVTEVDTGTGLTGGPITTTGTISLDTKLAPLDTLGTAGQLIRVNAGRTALEYFTAASGGVASVVGTTNRITVDSTDPANPIVDISASYVGQSSITTLGTIATGTWAGTAVAVAHGGTGGTSASITLFNNITGFSAAGTTGTTSTNLVFSTSPTFVTPTLGAATATSINKMAITAPATSSTLAVADGKTFTVSNTLTFTGTDSSSVAFGAGGTVLYSASTIPLTVGSTTITSGTSTRILYDNAGVLGEYTITGSGTVVAMQTAPTFVTSITSPKVIGGSGTTGTQLTLQTTTGNGTTDALVITGGNAGGTTFATFTTGALTITTSGVFTTGTIELGAASDTTLSRSSAGVLAVEGVVVDTISAANTLTNKTLTAPIMTSVAETGVGTADLLAPNNHAVTVSSNAGTCSQSFSVNTFTNSSAATMAITLGITTPTPKDGQFMVVRIYDFSAVAQTIGWTNTENSTVSAPTTSNGSTTLPLSVCFQYNAGTSKWRCVASA